MREPFSGSWDGVCQWVVPLTEWQMSQETPARAMSVTSLGQEVRSDCRFDLAADEIGQLALQSRPFSRFVDFENISLGPPAVSLPLIRLRQR